MKKHVDENGFPGTWQDSGQFDGGDTAAIVGTLLTLNPCPKFLNQYFQLMADNEPVRHPNFTKDPVSRDQLIPLITAAIMVGECWPTIKLYKMHRKRFFLTAWNGDPTGPEVWALWLRYKRPWWGRLILWALDLELLAGSIHWRFFRKDNVVRNHMLCSIVCFEVMPTFISRLAYWINDWPELTTRWRIHCIKVDEYPTWELFMDYV